MFDDDRDDEAETRRYGRILRGVLFVASAALFAVLLHFGWQRPYLFIPVGILMIAFFALRWWSRRRFVSMLRRGDVSEIISHWAQSVDRIPHPETMAPLMTATAFAAYGRVEDARRAMAAAARGPAWDAAIEHRLFLDTILSTFEGDSEHARQQADKLSSLPMPNPKAARERVGALRQAVCALVRAFQHRAEPEDIGRLEAASERSPLVHWAMRYAAAIIAVDRGEELKARALIEGAPTWPAESAFRSFHDEISNRLSTA